VNVIIFDPSIFYIHDLFQVLVANPPIVYIELINTVPISTKKKLGTKFHLDKVITFVG
jgi:hypothetical protein